MLGDAGRLPRITRRKPLVALLIALGVPAAAERLPLTNYTTVNGLPSSFIERIVVDSRGLLWFCTRDGLSRFDGSRFITYSTPEGLPISHVNHLVETRKGVFWVATNGGGVSRFDTSGSASRARSATNAPLERRRLFANYAVGDQPLTNRVNVLYEDRREQLWAGTDDGLFRLETHGGALQFRRFPLSPQAESPVTSFAEDRAGNLWVATYAGVVRIADGNLLVSQPYQSVGKVNSLLFDEQGNFWIGFDSAGLLAVHPDGTQTRFTARDGLPGDHVSALLQRPAGHVWIAGDGLAEFDHGRFRTYTRDQGLSWVRRGGLIGDHDGNLWLVTFSGAAKLALGGFSSYGPADGLAPSRIHSIYEDRGGNLVVTGIGTDQRVSIHEFDGKRFHSVSPALPDGATAVWPDQGAFPDRSGEWWFLTRKGLFRFPAVHPLALPRTQPRAVYDHNRGLAREDVSALYEDRAKDLWIGSAFRLIGGLTRLDRGRDVLQAYSEADGIPARWNTPTAFAEDHAGRLWVGFEFGGLARRDGNAFQAFTSRDGLPEDGIAALHVDQANRLWIASRNGVNRVDGLDTDHPRFTPYTAVAQGLSSNNIRCITEDRWDRLYFGSARGVDRLDPQTGRLRHYNSGDGLSSDFINAAYRDRHGVLWFGTYTGLSRLEPRLDEPASVPPIWIDRIRIAGIAHPVAENGERQIVGLTLPANANNIQIDFFSSSFAVGQTLRYQFMLEGADRDWSLPGDQRTVYYASLSPGSYRFLVRSVNAEGLYSESPAMVSFQVLAPFWLRWWFLVSAAAAAAGVLHAFHRTRVERLIQVERLRRRIAADLHDDIGASLSRVAVLSEVVKRQVGPENAEPTRRLGEIADTARTLVDDMSDIVWSVDPRRDDLHNVVLRIRQFAADVLADRPVAWNLSAPGGLEKIKLNPEQRRHLYLILKEALTNVARHSGSGFVSLTIHMDPGVMRAEIKDDGCGFDPAGVNGHGLENMRTRAAQVGGAIALDTSPGAGTRITLHVPLKKFGA